MRHGRLAPIIVSLLAFGLLLGACTDDGADVRTLDDGDASGTASGTGSGLASGVECTPVRPDLQADSTVPISLRDYSFDPEEVEFEGRVLRFEATNDGSEPHELAVLPGGGEVPFTDDGAPDEEALADGGAFELEAFPAGESCSAAWAFDPGTYTLFCIVESPDGETHYEKGMEASLTVTG